MFLFSPYIWIFILLLFYNIMFDAFFFLLSYAHCSTCSIVSSSFLHNGHDSCSSFFYNSFSRPFSVILFSRFIILIALDFVISYLLTKYFELFPVVIVSAAIVSALVFLLIELAILWHVCSIFVPYVVPWLTDFSIPLFSASTNGDSVVTLTLLFLDKAFITHYFKIWNS